MSKVRDCIALLGFSSLGYGLYCAWPPLAFIACGVSAIAFALYMPVKGKDK